MAITDLIARAGQAGGSPVEAYMRGREFKEQTDQRQFNRQMQIAKQQEGQRRYALEQQQQQQQHIANQTQAYAEEITPTLQWVSAQEDKQEAYTRALPEIKQIAEQLGVPTDKISEEWRQEQADALIAKYGSAKKRGDYYTTITGEGGQVYAFNTRTKETSPLEIKSAKYDPLTLEKAEWAKKYGKDSAELFVTAKHELPATEASADQSLDYIEELVNHPGMKDVIGLPDNPLGLKGYMWGTDAADFKSRFDQLTGRNFMQVFPTLKGGGQITEVEGEKATAAISRMRAATSESSFLKAAKDLTNEIEILRDIVRERAGKKEEPENNAILLEADKILGIK